MKVSLLAGPPTYAGVMLPSQATTSGNAVTFSGIPGWATRIMVSVAGVSTNGTTDIPLVRLGDSGGVETSGYLSSVQSGGGAAANNTTGFPVAGGVVAASVLHGSMLLTRHTADGTTWSAFGIFATSNAAATVVSAGSKALSAALDRVQFTLSGTPTDAFDAGSVTVHYW